jgi:DNA polymerase/3'-5' exonuclease PolX
MSSVATRMPLAEAEAVAARFVEQLSGTYDRLVIAGSIRRRLPTIGDVEIVAVPKVETVTALDMFGDPTHTGQVDLLGAHLTMLLDRGIVSKRPRSDGKFVWGQKMKYLTFEGVNVDLFTPEAARFGLILLIRTGPAAYSHQLVTEKGKALVVGHQPNGRPITRFGMLPPHLKVDKGWLTSRMSGIRIPTPEEQTFYEHTRLHYLEPWRRV